MLLALEPPGVAEAFIGHGRALVRVACEWIDAIIQGRSWGQGRSVLGSGERPRVPRVVRNPCGTAGARARVADNPWHPDPGRLRLDERIDPARGVARPIPRDAAALEFRGVIEAPGTEVGMGIAAPERPRLTAA